MVIILIICPEMQLSRLSIIQDDNCPDQYYSAIAIVQTNISQDYQPFKVIAVQKIHPRSASNTNVCKITVTFFTIIVFYI